MDFIKIRLFIYALNLGFLINSNAQTCYSEKGLASFYAPEFHGKKTASGENYDMNLLTAAHKNLPFNSYVKVTNLKNNKSVIIRINDRGPKSKQRIIDLSKAAAIRIDIIQAGVGKVKIEKVDSSETSILLTKETPFTKNGNDLISGKIYDISNQETKIQGFAVQLISFSDRNKMDKEIENLKAKVKNIYIEVSEVNSKKVYRILSGGFISKQSSLSELKRLKTFGYKGLIREFK